MADTSLPFTRFMAVGLQAWELSVQVAETMVASQSVIARRLSMIAADRPWPVAEFSRLVPEKTAAFGKANAGAARAFRRGAGTPALTGAAAQDGMAMLGLLEQSLGMASAWWGPVRAQAVANARRLGRG